MNFGSSFIILSTYDKGGALKNVELNAQIYVQDIHYDAKGQCMAIWYGNGTKTSYTYDPDTFRLRRLLTVNLNNNEKLQDLNYWFDPIGNITELQDHAQQTLFFNNSVVSPTQAFTYDALYRLIEASGRELIGTATFGVEDNWNDAAWQTTHKGDGNAVQNYTQKYTYDAVGNILELRHIADAGVYTRTYNIAVNSNRLLDTEVNTTIYAYAYDARGNMTEMPHLDAMHWNVNNELHKIENGTMEAYYQYSGGQRIRKYVDKGSIKEERIYLGNFEIYRKLVSGVLDVERTTIHVSDDTGRIAMLEVDHPVDEYDYDVEPPLTRYIYSNHLQSASLELDEEGEIISYEEYYPYGTTSYQAMNASINAVAKRYRYTGKERDEESGLYYHGARYYIPWLCRWTAVDPLNSLWYNSQNIDYENVKNREDLNNALQAKYPDLSSYNYCVNNPIKYLDPDGKKIVIKGSKEYRREVKKALSMIKQTDIGRKVYNELKNSKHTLTISEPTDEDIKKFKKQGRDTFEQQAHYNDGVNALPEDKNQLKMARELISNDPATFAHEFFHAFIDLIVYKDDDKLLKGEYDKRGQWDVQENPAMAFENYFRKIYGLGEREQYGYKGKEKAGIMGKLFSIFPEVQDEDSRIKVLDYGFDLYYEIGPGLDLQNRNLRTWDTGIMQYRKTDKSGTKIISDDINKEFTQP